MKQDVSRSIGFSMVEMLITILVATLLLVVAVPTFQNSMQNARINSEINALSNSLSFARMTSLSQGISTMVCPFGSAGSTTCGSNWSNGWIVITQPTTGSPALLQAFQAKSTTGTLTATGATNVLFSNRGLAQTQVNFKLCDSRGSSYGTSLVVMTTGYVQVAGSQGQAAWTGGSLTCP